MGDINPSESKIRIGYSCGNEVNWFSTEQEFSRKLKTHLRR
jgi:hypothetical protein